MYAGNIPKFGKKGDKYGHMEKVDMVGGLGPTWDRRSSPLGCRLAPQVALPRHLSVGAAPKPITSFHSSRFDQQTRFDAGGFMGPLS